MTDTKPHHGRNIKRFREWFDIKQETLASELNWSQQKVSMLEQREEIEDSVLSEVAKILKVPVDAIKKMDDQAAFNIIGNTYNDSAASVNYQPTFNPIEKILQLYDEKIALYEKLLKDKEARIEDLQKLK